MSPLGLTQLTPLTPEETPELAAFLGAADLTVGDLAAPTCRLWLLRGDSGAIVASTGFEIPDDAARDVLLRSVAVRSDHRRDGLGLQLARFALEAAAAQGAERAWLFSRRSGPFWQKLGFVPADRDALAARLAATQQVQLFSASGQLGYEVAWTRPLGPLGVAPTKATVSHGERENPAV